MRFLTPEQHERACQRATQSWKAGLAERLDATAFGDCVLQASLLGPEAEQMIARWRLPPQTGPLQSQTFRQMWRTLPRETRLRMPDVQGRWHLESQSHTFRHLRRLWADDRPRVMIDLGCHAGHTYRRNVSDALLWLDRFHHPGGVVLGVDIIEDFAFDLQHRLDHVPPYASLEVQKLTRTLAIGSKDGLRVPVDRQLTLGCTGTWTGTGSAEKTAIPLASLPPRLAHWPLREVRPRMTPPAPCASSWASPPKISPIALPMAVGSCSTRRVP